MRQSKRFFVWRDMLGTPRKVLVDEYGYQRVFQTPQEARQALITAMRKSPAWQRRIQDPQTMRRFQLEQVLVGMKANETRMKEQPRMREASPENRELRIERRR